MNRTPTMSRAHFQFIADVIKEMPDNERKDVAERFGNKLVLTNPRFKRDRFLSASGWKL